MTISDLPVLLRADEAAAFLKVTRGTLANWRSAGKGPRYCRWGQTIRYRRSDLELWLADGAARSVA